MENFSYAPEATAYVIKEQIKDFVPKVCIVLGSGLGAVAGSVENPIKISYDDLPCFRLTKILGHSATMYLGKIGKTNVVCLQGRTHFYEGCGSAYVIRNIVRTMKLLGCEILFTTNAVGSLRKDVPPGNLMVIKDHINFMFYNPLVGENDERFGERFTSLDNVYDSELRSSIISVSKSISIPLTESIFLGTIGPTFETHAEIRAFKMMGADSVGMSTIPEVLIARHCGLKVVSVSAVTNFAAGMSDSILSHEETLKWGKISSENLSKLVIEFTKSLSK